MVSQVRMANLSNIPVNIGDLKIHLSHLHALNVMELLRQKLQSAHDVEELVKRLFILIVSLRRSSGRLITVMD